jgi:hypothetical protein
MLYGDPENFTHELRALEAFAAQNPQSAPAHFVLACHYRTLEYPDAAVRQLRTAAALQPTDALAAQLLQQFDRAQQRAAATTLAQPEISIAAVAAAHAGTQRKLEGNWLARPSNDLMIGVAFEAGGRFTWKVYRQGADRQFQGISTTDNGNLTLAEDRTNRTILGSLRWTDETHFVFKLLGAGPGDPGLSFTRTS